MKVVRNGSKVRIRCEAKVEDEAVCFTTEEEELLELVVGEGKFFPALETELTGMKEGETKTVALEPLDTFGPHLDDLILDVPKGLFRADVVPELGARVRIDTPSKRVFYGKVTKINENSIVLDLNHPLAGKKIICTVTIVSIESN